MSARHRRDARLQLHCLIQPRVVSDLRISGNTRSRRAEKISRACAGTTTRMGTATHQAFHRPATCMWMSILRPARIPPPEDRTMPSDLRHRILGVLAPNIQSQPVVCNFFECGFEFLEADRLLNVAVCPG